MYIENKLLEEKEYFDNMFKKIDPNILLDEQQRSAVLLDADNVLVVAGAGSGKTTTMVAKVVYLIEKEHYKESEILVISFTKKVKEEISSILHDQFGFKGVNVTTFHALGLKIINQSGTNYKGIVAEEGQYKILSDYIKNELFSNKEKLSLFISSFSNYLYFDKEWEKFDNFNDYHDYAYKNKMLSQNFNIEKYNYEQIKKRREYKRTIKGEYLRSKEEVDIANFLYLNNIEYIYEKRYEDSINYYPDFYIKQLELENYIEHFGVDEHGSNDMYTDEELNSYLKNLKVKLSYFNEEFQRNKFIVTYSKYNNGDNYLDKLKRSLINKGYSLEKVSEEKIYEQLKNTSKDGYASKFISSILIPFISIFKQGGYKAEYFDQLILENDNELKEQLIVLKDFFIYYQKKLEEKQSIDFEDMIYLGYHKIDLVQEKDLGIDYKYLIIDEYQDISSSRFNLVKKMADLFSARVMAVGDDWQTIFGYSGSRIDLFKNFEVEMENAVKIPIEMTYRNSQELIDVAGDFVLKNKDQIFKNLRSNKSLKNPVLLVQYEDSNWKDLDKNRSDILEKILDFIIIQDKDAKVLLMGRYKKDLYKISNNEKFKLYKSKIVSKKYPDLKIDYLTIHQAKGLGYDYCVLLDLSDDIYGFPSKIEDLPVVKLIKPKITEEIDYPEERRLFYVALTRTKNKIFILTPKSKASVFAFEIEKYENVKVVRNYL